MKKIMIAGYHGYGNAGDDATLITIIDSTRRIKNDTDIIVLSKTPKTTRKKYGVKAINRFNIFQVFFSMVGADAIVLGGGTLLQDVTSKRSILYYLGLMRMAKFLGKKVMLYSNGMGPIKDEKNRKKTSKVLNKLDMITLRESYAKSEFEALNIAKPEIHITSDPAFMLDYMIENREEHLTENKYFKSEGIPTDKKVVCVVIRKYKGRENYEEVIAKICDYLIEKHDVNIVFIPFQHPDDHEISVSVQFIMKNKSYVMNERYDVKDILNIMKDSYLNICMRLHGVIFSALCNVPVVGIAYDPKVEYYLNIIKMPILGTNLDISCEKSIDKLDDLIQNYDARREEMSKCVVDLKRKSKENEEFLKKFIKSF